MIYMHDKDGNVSNEYSIMSGIESVVEYECDGKYNPCTLTVDRNEKRKIHVACENETYARDWAKRHENFREVMVADRISCCPITVVSTAVGDYAWWSRNVIKVDWNKDYHFYYI